MVTLQRLRYQSSRHRTLRCRDGLAMIPVPSTSPALPSINHCGAIYTYFIHCNALFDPKTDCLDINCCSLISCLHLRKRRAYITYICLLYASNKSHRCRHPCVRNLFQTSRFQTEMKQIEKSGDFGHI